MTSENPISQKYQKAAFQSNFATRSVRAGFVPSDHLEQSPAIFATAAFHYKDAAHADGIYGVFAPPIPGNDYSRTANPTNEIFEKRLANLEGAEAGIACSSGIHAIFLAIATKCSAGDHLVCSEIVYGNTVRLLEKSLARFGITASFADPTNVSDWEKKIQKNTRLFFLESPTNPTLDVSDIRGICALAKSRGIFSVVDNTIVTPAGQNPILLGADVVVHSATKYIDGGGRAVGGAVVGSQEFCDEIRTGLLREVGGCLSPFHSWIYIKSLETLLLRVRQHSQNALSVAEFLERHPAVESVKYPFLPSHPHYKLAKSQQSLGGGLLSFRLRGDLKKTQKLVDSVKMISLIGNMGDAQTIIGIPGRSSHSRLSDEHRKKVGISENLIRLSVGLEDPLDICSDLENALGQL